MQGRRPRAQIGSRSSTCSALPDRLRPRRQVRSGASPINKDQLILRMDFAESAKSLNSGGDVTSVGSTRTSTSSNVAATSACHAARADILLRMGRCGEAAAAYRRALALATNRVEQEFLKRRLAAAADPS